MNFKALVLFTLLIFSLSAVAQDSNKENAFLRRIFLPSIDVGYQFPNSSLLDPSLRISTSVEYRFTNNNDFFLRLNYDTNAARYNLNDSITSNNIEGTVQSQDVFLAPGYRFGDNKLRFMISFMPGIKFYEFPTASVNGQQITISQSGQSLFTTSILGTAEYYFDKKSAFTFSLYQNQVWQDVDFWADGRSAVGFSIGYNITTITSQKRGCLKRAPFFMDLRLVEVRL